VPCWSLIQRSAPRAIATEQAPRGGLDVTHENRSRRALEAEIDEQHVDRIGAQLGDRLGRRARRGHVEAIPEERLGELLVLAAILHDEHLPFGHASAW